MTDEPAIAQNPKPRIHIILRIFLYIVASLIGIGIFQVLGYLICGVSLSDLQEKTEPGAFKQVIVDLFGLIPLFLLTWLFRKYLDRRTFLSLGFSPKGKGIDVILGLAVAIILYAIGTLSLIATGNIGFSKLGISMQTLFLNFLTFIVVAITEELMVRGYILNNLLSVMNKYLALFISAVIFAAMHSLNSGLTWLAMVNLFLAGVLLGSTYIFTGNLTFAFSLHLFWNFIQGPVLGYHVSGNITESYLSATPSGSTLMSGGEFGFEGSLVCTLLCLALSVILIMYYERKSKLDA